MSLHKFKLAVVAIGAVLIGILPGTVFGYGELDSLWLVVWIISATAVMHLIVWRTG